MPKVNKDALVGLIAADTPYDRETVNIITKSVFDNIKYLLSQGNEVQLNGFGTFELKHRAPRTGMNPHTGKPVPIPARIVPTFKPSPQLKEVTMREINESKRKK